MCVCHSQHRLPSGESERLGFHIGNAVLSGDVNILFPSYSLRPVLNIHTALRISNLSILADFRLLREEGVLQCWQLFTESAVVYATSVSLQHI